MTLPAGIHDGVKMGDYLLHHGLSSGKLHVLLTQSPFHALHDAGGEPSEGSDTGIAIHDGLLEGVDRLVPIAFDDYKKQAARDARDAARADNKIPILERKLSQIQAATDAAKRYVASSEIAGVFERGKPEQTIIWQEGEIICKARPDWLTNERDIVLHVKTTQGSAEPSSWIRNQLVANGYDVAHAFYERGASTAIGIPFGLQSIFLVIEQNPPYGCSLIALAPAMMDLASRKVERAIATWQQCRANEAYPCYPSRICYAEPMAWQMADEEEREVLAPIGGERDEMMDKYGAQA